MSFGYLLVWSVSEYLADRGCGPGDISVHPISLFTHLLLLAQMSSSFNKSILLLFSFHQPTSVPKLFLLRSTSVPVVVDCLYMGYIVK